MKPLANTVFGIAAAATMSLAAVQADAAAIPQTTTPILASSTGFAPLASLPVGPSGPAITDERAKLVKVAQRRGRGRNRIRRRGRGRGRGRRRGRRIGAGIGAAIVGGIILNEIARNRSYRSDDYYYDEPAYYAGPRRRVYSCRQLKKSCKWGNRRHCYRWEDRCTY